MVKMVPLVDKFRSRFYQNFRSQRSCETQLVQFYHDLVSNLDRAVGRGHRQTDVIVMDFAKAFDKVPHKRLLYKLDFYGIRGSTHKWIDSWLWEQDNSPTRQLTDTVLETIHRQILRVMYNLGTFLEGPRDQGLVPQGPRAII